MFTKLTKKDPSRLDQEIDRVLDLMSREDPETEKYAQWADQVTKLYKLKEIDSKQRVSKDALAAIAGNLLGIGMILSYERVHIVTSKAVGFVLKAK